MRRLSRSSQLTLLVVAVALAVLAMGALALHGEPTGTAQASTSVASVRAPASPSAAESPSPLGLVPASAAPPPSLAPGSGLSLGQLLALLATAPEDRTGYDRSLFRHWIDADGDGCDTRREVLIAEAVLTPTVGGGCSLFGGRWVSAYDGLVLTDASELQIDHVVALAEAWDSGASGWSPDRRMQFANDLGVSWALIAVSAASNQSKSDNDPADWVPPDSGDLCPFVSAWIAVKVRWELSVDPRERDALADLVTECPDARMPVVQAPPSAESTPALGTGATGCSAAYPTVCIPPPPPDLDCGDIPYRRFKVLPPDPHRFDGNRDGIGCES